MSANGRARAALRARHDAAWRDPAEVGALWPRAGAVDPRLLEHRVRGAFWDVLAEHDVTLLVTREYEHLVLALGVAAGRPTTTYLPLPHPSGLAWSATEGVLHVASTRNPNAVYRLRPAVALGAAAAGGARPVRERPLVPSGSCFYPGCLYLHDLALIGGRLHGNAVGQNAVVRLEPDGRYTHVWWPRAVERDGVPDFSRNYLQLNSIAAGPDPEHSFYSASTDAPAARRPGQRHFPVDRRGVVFDGTTREPIARGLTRPHSARLLDGRVWVANSGYGELGVVEDGGLAGRIRLPGWTRGLAFAGSVAFAGTSRVLPRFRQYAPGLDVDDSVCGVHAVDTRSGRVLGSVVWPWGNQIFAVEPVPARHTRGLPFAAGRRRALVRERELFYCYETTSPEKEPVP
jgi:uncharacterized protein (TIGR03032 family)